jgi:hypothetical protein
MKTEKAGRRKRTPKQRKAASEAATKRWAERKAGAAIQSIVSSPSEESVQDSFDDLRAIVRTLSNQSLTNRRATLAYLNSRYAGDVSPI